MLGGLSVDFYPYVYSEVKKCFFFITQNFWFKGVVVSVDGGGRGVGTQNQINRASDWPRIIGINGLLKLSDPEDNKEQS